MADQLWFIWHAYEKKKKWDFVLAGGGLFRTAGVSWQKRQRRNEKRNFWAENGKLFRRLRTSERGTYCRSAKQSGGGNRICKFWCIYLSPRTENAPFQSCILLRITRYNDYVMRPRSYSRGLRNRKTYANSNANAKFNARHSKRR